MPVSVSTATPVSGVIPCATSTSTLATATPGSSLGVGSSYEATFLAESQTLTGRRRRRTATDPGFLVHDSERD